MAEAVDQLLPMKAMARIVEVFVRKHKGKKRTGTN
jgi:hypothetical protein